MSGRRYGQIVGITPSRSVPWNGSAFCPASSRRSPAATRMRRARTSFQVRGRRGAMTPADVGRVRLDAADGAGAGSEGIRPTYADQAHLVALAVDAARGGDTETLTRALAAGGGRSTRPASAAT